MNALSSMDSPSQISVVRRSRSILWAARTRILALYAFLLLLFEIASIIAFRHFLFLHVDARVRQSLVEEVEEFKRTLATWQANAPPTPAAARAFTEQYLRTRLLEDDNFLLVSFNGKLHTSNPATLPEALLAYPDWLARCAIATERQCTQTAWSPEVGELSYTVIPIPLAAGNSGNFIAVHTTAGERKKAFEGTLVFARVIGLAALPALLLAWIFSDKVLAPVRELSAIAQQIGDTDLTRRLAVEGTGEVAELAKSFNAMLDRLQQAFVTQREFIRDAGHELRTPIAIIQGHLEVMGDDPQERQETIELVLDELNRMQRIVGDLSLLAKAEQPDFLHLGTLNISALVNNLYAKVNTLAERNWQLEARAAGTIVADSQRLTQALMNLVLNAVQQTQPEDRITIGSATTQEGVRLWVEDTGEGIAPDDRERIFNRFARASRKRRSSDGAGLGLAIVQAIVQAHGGRIELTSHLGRGSTFTIVLPKATHASYLLSTYRHEPHSHC